MSIERINRCFQMVLLAVGVVVCTVSLAQNGYTQSPSDTTRKVEAVAVDTTPRVVGVGGIFFKCDSPKVVKEWYNKNLGLPIDAYGTMFVSRNFDNPGKLDRLQWSAFKSTTKYFDPSTRDFMINYRVNALEALVKKFKESGVTIVDTMETYEYGKFIHIMDPYGNKIELWEPPDTLEAPLEASPAKK